MKKILYITLLLLSVLSTTKAQEIKIKNVSLQPDDKTAIIHPCLDGNGDTCAVIKIKTDNLEGIKFSNPNQYIKTSYADGVYSVYVPAISRKLDFQHSDYMPVHIDMAEYGYRKLRKGKTYVVVIDATKASDLESVVILKVKPSNAKVVFDEKDYEADENGIVKINVKNGSHRYSIAYENHRPANGTISIDKTETKTVPITLQPITYEILIISNVSDARVFVDNIDYGTVGKITIPQGMHKIRLQADGYIDKEQECNVNATTKNISFELRENKRTLHIHPTPVKIFSAGRAIYKNNKEIKGWVSGQEILLMPGKYEISNDYDVSKIIEVGTKPMEVHLK